MQQQKTNDVTKNKRTKNYNKTQLLTVLVLPWHQIQWRPQGSSFLPAQYSHTWGQSSYPETLTFWPATDCHFSVLDMTCKIVSYAHSDMIHYIIIYYIIISIWLASNFVFYQ